MTNFFDNTFLWAMLIIGMVFSAFIYNDPTVDFGDVANQFGLIVDSLSSTL